MSRLNPFHYARQAVLNTQRYLISLVTSSQLSAASEDVLYELFDANIAPL